MRLNRLLQISSGLALLLLPEVAMMDVIDISTNVGSNPCIISSLICPGGGIAGLALYIQTVLFFGAQRGFMAVSILMFLFYGVRLMLESSEESTISEVKSAYTYGISGAAIVSLSSIIVQTVGQGHGGGPIVDQTAVASTLGSIELYLRIMVGTSVVAMIVYQGIRLIILQGEESELDAQKKKFFNALIGVSVILLASAAVNAFTQTQSGGNLLTKEIVGIGNFLLEIMGGLSVFSFIIAGFFLVISVDEALKDRAKKAMFTTVVAMIVVMCSYAIINFVITLP